MTAWRLRCSTAPEVECLLLSQAQDLQGTQTVAKNRQKRETERSRKEGADTKVKEMMGLLAGWLPHQLCWLHGEASFVLVWRELSQLWQGVL